MGDRRAAVELAETASGMAPPDTRLPAIATTYAAHGHALGGDAAESARAYHLANELIDSTDMSPGSQWGTWLDAAYIGVQHAHSLAVLGNHAEAAEGFEQALSELPTGYPRDRGVYLARAALAHAGCREADRAASLGTEALAVGGHTGSGRIAAELRRLDDLLGEQNTRDVREFRDAVRTAGVV
jgi:tetratricopeptide (TPR) repeat protein